MSLPINFHKTFIPERRLISSLLSYAAQGKSGDYQSIAETTGIPMGKSSGKVPAILDYAMGMGLITMNKQSKNAIKEPSLSEFGRIVFLEDKLMGESITQWLAHMNLCRADIGAKAWNHVFSKPGRMLGKTFKLDQLENHLVNAFGAGKNRTGPLVRMYLDDASFDRAGIIRCENNVVVRNKAPLLDAFGLPYAAYALTLLETFFPDQLQITTLDMNEKTSWFEICSWEQTDVERALSLIERTGHISIDRLSRPWVLERKNKAANVWPRIYDNLA